MYNHYRKCFNTICRSYKKLPYNFRIPNKNAYNIFISNTQKTIYRELSFLKDIFYLVNKDGFAYLLEYHLVKLIFEDTDALNYIRGAERDELLSSIFKYELFKIYGYSLPIEIVSAISLTNKHNKINY